VYVYGVVRVPIEVGLYRYDTQDISTRTCDLFRSFYSENGYSEAESNTSTLSCGKLFGAGWGICFLGYPGRRDL
jgi:hypothetical protein